MRDSDMGMFQQVIDHFESMELVEASERDFIFRVQKNGLPTDDTEIVCLITHGMDRDDITIESYGSR